MEMTLGERIRKARKGKMTQAELAEKIGVHEITVRRWELGERLPDTDSIQKISQVLGVSISELMGEDVVNPVRNNAEGRILPGLAYWGGVADNARNVAREGSSEDIADVVQLLKRALAYLGAMNSKTATA